MRFVIGITAISALLVSAQSAVAQRGRGPNPGKYGWMSDYDAAKQRAKQTGKPIMLVLRCAP